MIEHDMTIVVPEWAMDETLVVLHVLRAGHRSAGGTSKLRRSGQRLKLTFAGPPDAVLDMAALVDGMRKQLERVIALRACADRLEAAVRAER